MTFHDLVAYTLAGMSNEFPTHLKRDGVYFPSTGNLLAEELFELVEPLSCHSEGAFDDDLSTWEFTAPVAALNLSSLDSEASTCNSPSPTPAQDVAYRYRAGLKVDIGECSSSSENSSSNESHATSFFDDSDDDSSFTSSLEDAPSSPSSLMTAFSIPIPLNQEIRPRFRESRAHALLDIREEALEVLRMDKLTEHDPVVCHRADCRDTLANMKALMYHLHIHNMYDRNYECELCGKGFESRRYLAMHHCPKLPTSCPSSPIRDTLMRVITKITSRE
ncbi:hypothetical protein R3P38DRAFT_3037109 [Favolaschia claudopus]|uniref:C2H2-type domain-containing protein n=1 Tax=Favolaschia claudopus TaxID=2862362 RepID=A0AAW0AAH2_9AGAR